jgi:hypothetical protein
MTETIYGSIYAAGHVIEATAKEVARIRQMSGIPPNVCLEHHSRPWKNDDADWFRANPTRSHRARHAHPGEVPPGQELMAMVLVRQVEPGSRVRIGFYPNPDQPPIPDDEEIIHAMFDAVVESESSGEPLTAQKVLDRLAIMQRGVQS